MGLVAGKSYKLDIGRVAIVRSLDKEKNEIWVEFPPVRGMKRYDLDLFAGWVVKEFVRKTDKFEGIPLEEAIA